MARVTYSTTTTETEGRVVRLDVSEDVCNEPGTCPVCPEAVATITRQCPMCGKHSSQDVPERVLAAKAARVPIQQAWPTGSTSQREFLLTGYCPECMDLIFGTPED